MVGYCVGICDIVGMWWVVDDIEGFICIFFEGFNEFFNGNVVFGIDIEYLVWVVGCNFIEMF